MTFRLPLESCISESFWAADIEAHLNTHVIIGLEVSIQDSFIDIVESTNSKQAYDLCDSLKFVK